MGNLGILRIVCMYVCMPRAPSCVVKRYFSHNAHISVLLPFLYFYYCNFTILTCPLSCIMIHECNKHDYDYDYNVTLKNSHTTENKREFQKETDY
jgi:hypothetical protein